MSTKKLIYYSIFIALGVIINRFLSIHLPFMQIGFTFIPTILAAIYFGPKGGALICAIIDVIGATLFPKNGAYFPGFTLSAALSGLIYGLFLYKKKINYKNLFTAITVRMVVISFILNPLWLHMLYNKGYIAIISVRIVNDLVMIPIEMIVIKYLYKYLQNSKINLQ